MASNPFLGDGLRPDQQKWASTQFGMVSPMWLPFIAAAGMGAAWWGMTHWARVMGAGYPGIASRTPAPSNGAAAPAAAAASPSAVPLDQVSARSAAVAAPEPTPAPRPVASLAPEAEQLQAGLAEQPAAAALSESLAVQGQDDATDAVAPALREAQAPAPKPAAAAPAPEAPAQPAAAHAHGDHEKPEPILPPHEGLPARKKGGGKKKG